MPSHRVYEQLLKLYPKAYREKYAGQMLQTLTDMLDDQPSRAGRARIRLQAGLDLSLSIAQQSVLTIGDNLMHETPSYVKRTSIIGGLLVLPFFIVVASGVLQDKGIMHAHLWASLVAVCLLVLPAAAFVLNVAGYLAWFTDKSVQKKRSMWRRIGDVKRAWPMLAAGGIGLCLLLFVLFHDSAHCVVGNPIRIVRNPTQTRQCVSRGFLGGK